LRALSIEIDPIMHSAQSQCGSFCDAISSWYSYSQLAPKFSFAISKGETAGEGKNAFLAPPIDAVGRNERMRSEKGFSRR
jgi:hypothetical protein